MKLDSDKFADVEFGPPKRAEENFFRRKRHAGRLDPVDLDSAVDQRPRAVVRADGDGKIELGHEKPGWLKNPGLS